MKKYQILVAIFATISTLTFSACNDDNDYEKALSHPDFKELSGLVKEMFPQATILDIDKDKGMTEVSIWDEQREKDVYFDEQKQWIRTSWDVRTSELPQEVKQAVTVTHPGFGIDDAEYVHALTGNWYELDLENNSTDQELKNLKITAGGTWL